MVFLTPITFSPLALLLHVLYYISFCYGRQWENISYVVIAHGILWAL